VQTNNTKCVLKGTLIQASGLKIVKTCTFQYSSHSWTATVSTIHPFCDGFLNAGFPSLRKVKLFIPILAFVQWPIWGVLSLSGLHNALTEAPCFTLLKVPISSSASSTNTAVGNYSLLNTLQKHKHMSSSTLVPLSQLANLKKKVYETGSSYIRISYFNSYGNRMNYNIVPYQKPPDRKFPLLLCGSWLEPPSSLSWHTE
jgi:hypothetical protein